MRIRQLEGYDINTLLEWHSRSGFDYKFPNLAEFLPIPVVTDHRDCPVMVVASLPTVELFMMGDPEWETPGIRMEAFKAIHEFVRKDLLSRKIIEANAWVPPEVEPSFGRRLRNMGWNKSRGWTCYSRRTDHV